MMTRRHRSSAAVAPIPEWCFDAALIIWQQLPQIQESARRVASEAAAPDAPLAEFVDRVASLIAYQLPPGEGGS